MGKRESRCARRNMGIKREGIVKERDGLDKKIDGVDRWTVDRRRSAEK
jgi:hypothetical protein